MITIQSGAQLAWAEMTAEEKQKRDEFRKSLIEQKAKIKALVEKQVADKRLLRMPHSSIPEITCGNEKYAFKYSGISAAGMLMSGTRARADTISAALIHYLQFRGKPFEQHMKKS